MSGKSPACAGLLFCTHHLCTAPARLPLYLLPMKLLGRIQAGFASPAEEDAADIISIEEFLLRDKEASYLLRVQGDSMKDAGILDGDLVVFERTHACRPGDIVVALIEDGYTLKYFRLDRGRAYLEAANPAYPALHPKEGQILGVVTGSLRAYK